MTIDDGARALAYARFSSDRQSDQSIEDQIFLCRRHAEKQGYMIVGCFEDRALSGASRFRPGYSAMLDRLREGDIDILLAESLDRLSRDQEDIAGLYKRLRHLGITIVTLAEGPVSELHVGLKGTMNALYLKDLAQKTHRGLEGRVRQGRSAGGNAYGYRISRRLDAQGEPIRGEREIDPDQAEVIRRIFRAFARGESPRAIAATLNREGIPGPRGAQWRDTAIRGHRIRGTGILNNELYIGRLVWNRLRYSKDPDTGRRVSRRNAAEDILVEQVPHLRIVDDALWESVKQRQQQIDALPGTRKIKASGFWLRKRPRHLLTGLVRCGTCGSTMAAIGKDYLGCSNARGAGTCDNRRSVRRAAIETIVVDALRTQLMQPDAVAAFIEAANARLGELSRERDRRTRQQDSELGRIGRQIERLIDAIADGYRTPDMKEKLFRLEARKAELLAGQARRDKPLPVLHPGLAEAYRRKLADLAATLDTPSIRAQAREQIRGLIEAVIVHPSPEGPMIELRGEIGRLLRLAGGAALADADPDWLCSVKVVAGA